MATENVGFQKISHGQQQNIKVAQATDSLYLGRTVSSNIYDVDCRNIARRTDKAADSTGGP